MEKIKKSEWKALNKDYKDIINGQRYILKLVNGATCLVPVEVIDDKEDLKNGKKKN